MGLIYEILAFFEEVNWASVFFGCLIALVVLVMAWACFSELTDTDHRYYEPDMVHPIGN